MQCIHCFSLRCQMNKKRSIKGKVILTILIGIFAVFLYIYLLNIGQNRTVTHQIQEEMAEDMQRINAAYQSASAQHDNIQDSFDSLYLSDLGFLVQMTTDYINTNIPEADFYSSDDMRDYEIPLYEMLLGFIQQYFDFYDIIIADREGNIIVSAEYRYQDFKDEVYLPLREVFRTEQPAVLHVLSEEDACTKYGSTVEADLRSEEMINICNLYARPLYMDYEMIISVPALEQTFIRAYSDKWTVLLKNEVIGNEGYAFVWSEETKKILFYPASTGKNYKYHNIEELGMDMDKIRDGKYVWTTIDGEMMYVYPVYNEEQDVWTACTVSREEMISSRRLITFLQWGLFSMLAAALVFYVILLLRQDKIQVLTDFTGSGKLYAFQSRQYKLFFITVMVSTLMILYVFYLQTLHLMSSWAASSNYQTLSIQTSVGFNETLADRYISLYQTERRRQASALGTYLSKDTSQWTTEKLDIFSLTLDITNIQILDKEGKSKVGTSYTYEPSKPYAAGTEEALDYFQLVSEQDTDRDRFNWMKDGRRDIQTMKNAEGKVFSYLYIYYYSDMVDQVLNEFSLQGTLNRVSPGKNGFVFAVDRENHTFSYYPNGTLTGADVEDYGLKESQLKDNYCNYIKVDNITYYATTNKIGNNTIFYVIKKSDLFQSRLLLSATAVILAFVLFLVIGIMIYTSRQQIEMMEPVYEKWDEQTHRTTSEYKLMQLLKYYVAFAAMLVTIFSGLRNVMVSDNMYDYVLFSYVLDGNWEQGINVFALTASILILSRGGIILFIANRLVGKVRNIFSSRISTILRVMMSLFTYIGIGILLYQCMICFGLKPSALMASTGVIAVVLGIGANSLVGDVIAGIFLLMEGDVQVGDVVRIGDFRGYIMEIGVRITKIYDMDSEDIKIVSNNEVRNVVHMSMRRAYVFSEFQIRYEETLEDVEEILKRELKNVRNKSPFILEGPNYIGVSKLGDSGVCLKTSTRCHEAYRKKVEREVNHIVYSIFQKYNIDVPYPQVTVHPGDDERIERKSGDGSQDDDTRKMTPGR